jgi:flagellar L-ring protein FlgH
MNRRLIAQSLGTPAFCAMVLAGCASTSSPVAGPPFVAAPVPKPIYLERVNNGSIYQANMPAATLFSSDRRPSGIGDTLKVNIDEKLSVSRKLSTDNSRENAMASKGPGGSAGNNILTRLLDLNASASGSDSFKGSGSTDHNSSFSGQIAATVINVLPNGNLVVAGQRSVMLNGSLGTLRFAGLVNPQDLQAGNVVSSSNVVNARFEVGGEGEVQEAASRSWIQRLLTNQLAIW